MSICAKKMEGAGLIRQAGAEDAAGVAALHVAVWRDTFAGMAPASAVEALGMAARGPYWARVLGAPEPGEATFVAEEAGRMVGLVNAGPARMAEIGARGQVRHLYVDPACQGGGLGRALLGRAFAHLAAAGFVGVGLAVVQENHAARRFYRRMGGVEVAQVMGPGPLWLTMDVVVVWEG